MCGLVGILHYGASGTPEIPLLKRMADTLRHRGPDDEGYWAEGPAGLGFRRLSIIDLAGGHQPMPSPACRGLPAGRRRVVFNGEIYNFKELRAALEAKGHVFASASDTEAILHAHEEWGDDLLARLEGMFAFALWDAEVKRLLLARDRLGKKPLYWSAAGGRLLFGSEIKALLAGLPRRPDLRPTAIDDYLTYQYIPGPGTVFEGIERLSPAHAMAWTAGGDRKTWRYWHPGVLPKWDISEGEAAERLRGLLRDAVRARLIADVPIGAFLSGGVDSSAVVGFMAEAMDRPVKTFSVGFAEEAFNELAYARQAARHFSTDHTEIMVEADMMSVLPRIVWQYDQPYADASALPSYFVAKETRKHVTVALNGDGGDENFGGYLRYLFAAFAARSLSRVPRFLRRGMAAAADVFPERWMARRLGRRLITGLRSLDQDPGEINFSLFRFFGDDDKKTLYAPAFRGRLGDHRAADYLFGYYREAGTSDPVDQFLHADLHTYLPEDLLVKMDVATMTHALEGRSPLLDHRVVEFAARLPSRWKIKGRRGKVILKKALEGFLPPEILKRRKMGFGVPLQKWMGDVHHEKVRALLLSPEASARGYFARDAVEKILDDHRGGRRDHGYRLWALLMLELWHRVFVDGTLSPEDPF